ncbi:HupE/UreJ family protein [Legionella sp. D16C41]|uniref:HupE/UreJ family protein n=1 Tax=Legionella sp. D16C41 TaxID=3402688 RepID=UPI003AF9C806
MHKITSASLPKFAVALLAILLPSLVFAHHAEFMRGHPLWQGLSMPIHGVDHILFTIAVGMIAAQIGGRALWGIPLLYTVALVCGGILNIMGIGVPLLDYVILASLVVCAALLSWPLSASLLLTVGLVSLFTIFQGNDMITPDNIVSNMPLFIAGCLVSSLVLLSIGIGLGLLILRFNTALFRYASVFMLAAAVLIGTFPALNNVVISLLEA